MVLVCNKKGISRKCIGRSVFRESVMEKVILRKCDGRRVFRESVLGEGNLGKVWRENGILGEI